MTDATRGPSNLLNSTIGAKIIMATTGAIIAWAT